MSGGRKQLPAAHGMTELWRADRSPLFHETMMICGSLRAADGRHTRILHPIGIAVIERSTAEQRGRILANIRSILLGRINDDGQFIYAE